jgi:hypothetical protein
VLDLTQQLLAIRTFDLARATPLEPAAVPPAAALT